MKSVENLLVENIKKTQKNFKTKKKTQEKMSSNTKPHTSSAHRDDFLFFVLKKLR